MYLTNTWLNTIKDCKLGKKSDVASQQWLDYTKDAVSDSLTEIRELQDWLDGEVVKNVE